MPKELITALIAGGGMARVLRNASWLTLARVCVDLLALGLFLAVSRRFGPEGVGAYSFGLALAGVCAVASSPALHEFGMRSYATSGPKERPAFLKELLFVQAGFALFATALVAVLAVFVATPESRWPFVLLAAYLAAVSISRVLFVPLYAAETMRLPAAVEVAGRFAAVAGSAGLLWLTPATLAQALIPFPAAGAAALAFAAWTLAVKAPNLQGAGALPLHEWLSRVRRTGKGVAPFAVTEVTGQLYARVDIVLLSLIHGTVATGLYAPAIKLVEAGVAPLVLLTTAAFPAFAKARQDGQATFERLVADVLRLNLTLGGCVALGFAFVLPSLLVPVFGQDFAPTVAFLPWAGLLAAIMSLELVLLRLLLIVGAEGRAMRRLIAGLLCNLALNAALIPPFGAAGAMAAVILSLATLAAIYGQGLRDGLDLRPVANVVLRAASALALAAGAGLAVGLATSSDVAAAVAAFGAFAALAWALGLVPRRAPGGDGADRSDRPPGG